MEPGHTGPRGEGSFVPLWPSKRKRCELWRATVGKFSAETKTKTRFAFSRSPLARNKISSIISPVSNLLIVKVMYFWRVAADEKY